MSVKKTSLKNTDKVLADYYRGTCMKLYTVVIIEGIAIIALFGLWVFESMQCTH